MLGVGLISISIHANLLRTGKSKVVDNGVSDGLFEFRSLSTSQPRSMKVSFCMNSHILDILGKL